MSSYGNLSLLFTEFESKFKKLRAAAFNGRSSHYARASARLACEHVPGSQQLSLAAFASGAFVMRASSRNLHVLALTISGSNKLKSMVK